MVNDIQTELVKSLLYNWSQKNVEYLLLDDKSLINISNNLNIFMKYKKISENSKDEFNKFTFAFAAMENCPNLIWHYNPTDAKLNLKFTDEEKQELISNFKTIIADKKEEVNEISEMILSGSEDSFIKYNKKVK